MSKKSNFNRSSLSSKIVINVSDNTRDLAIMLSEIEGRNLSSYVRKSLMDKIKSDLSEYGLSEEEVLNGKGSI